MNAARWVIAGFAAVAALSGCATQTPVSGDFPPVTPRQAQNGQYAGATVRWGGILIKTEPEAHETCFRVMGLPLDHAGKPEAEPRETETGRFVACASGFYDPVLYAAGREITFVGTVGKVKTETVGGYEYPYPQLAAGVVYLWPKRAGRPEGRRWYYNGYYRWQPGWWWWDEWGPEPPPPYTRPPHRRPPSHPPAPSTGPGRGGGAHRPPPSGPPIRIHATHPSRPPAEHRPPAHPRRPRPASPPRSTPSHPPPGRHAPPPSHHQPRPPREQPHPHPPPHPGSHGRALVVAAGGS